MTLNNGLTVFIPVYNEAAILRKNIHVLQQYLESMKIPYEIIIGSNGSTDKTPEIGKTVAITYAHVKFFHLKLRGPGLAFKEALNKASYMFFLCIDADLSTDLDFILRAIFYLQTYDAVVGSKLVGKQTRPLFRVLVSEFFIKCTNLLLNMPYRDYSIGAKAYRAESIRPFISDIDRHTFYTQALLWQLQKNGGKIIEIPVNCWDYRKSKFNLLHEGIYRYYKLLHLWIKNIRD
ncbi:MAG: glycosyltransferase family 2 protein [Desulfobacterales bacterium]|nr:glycosyltransferase family 2 protein [Desulfobacterales bacterium]